MTRITVGTPVGKLITNLSWVSLYESPSKASVNGYTTVQIPPMTLALCLEFQKWKLNEDYLAKILMKHGFGWVFFSSSWRDWRENDSSLGLPSGKK